MNWRRWEVWMTGTEDGEPYGEPVARCFTRIGASLCAHHHSVDHLTPRFLAMWNRRWPNNQLTMPRYSVCRRP